MALSLETHRSMFRRNTPTKHNAQSNNAERHSRLSKITDTELTTIKNDLSLIWLILESDVNGDCTSQALDKIGKLYERIASLSV